MNEPTTPDRYWTIAEVADHLRVSRMTVYRLADSGAFPGTIRVGRAYRIPGSGLQAYLAASTIEATP
ncbi:helix-turn-helix domain-containing protein [Nonomuraea sp. NPDC004580]|uniref:helix-turn-helix transcriptional regulator n=1 Tax=Nonomuraea sp. NPDC004580 TaxID=3154552 RepID=UPI0033ADFDCA